MDFKCTWYIYRLWIIVWTLIGSMLQIIYRSNDIKNTNFGSSPQRGTSEVQRPNLKLIFLYFCTFYVLTFFFFIFWPFCTFVLLYFCTFCTFVLSHLVGQCIWTSMQNLESVARKMTELWVLLYLCTFFCTFCTFVLL